MTSSVQVAVSGNKQIKVKAGQIETTMQPGSHSTFNIHDDQTLVIQETGEFISDPTLPLVKSEYIQKPEEKFLPHQSRVILEKEELDERLKKLLSFIFENPTYLALSESDQALLTKQSEVMGQLSEILDKRIKAFVTNTGQ